MPGVPRRLRSWLSALLLLTLVSLLVWQLWAASAAPAVAPPTATAPLTSAPFPDRSAASAFTADQTAVLTVVAAYNAAEAEVGQTLALTPILPLLEPNSPLAQRRAQEIATRQRTQAVHTTHLLRWAVRAITVDAAGTTATVLTQETWEDRAGTQLPRVATVRVAYTLRRADSYSPWRIVDAQSTLL